MIRVWEWVFVHGRAIGLVVIMGIGLVLWKGYDVPLLVVGLVLIMSGLAHTLQDGADRMKGD